jgi:hypothetical protein
MRRRAAASLGLALLAGGCAQQGGGMGESLSGRPSLDAAAARLPAQVVGFTRGDAVWHERARPGQGVAVDYAGPSRAAVATVSIYDRGQGAVSSQPGDARVAQEFSNAVAEVLAQADSRTSQNMAERGRSQLAVPGGAPLTCARLEGTYGRQPVGTLVCLGAAAGRFLKVQVTSSARPVRPVDPEPFIIGIAQAARG